MARKTVRSKGMLVGILLTISVFILFLVIKGAFFSAGKQAVAVVEEFYQYEQAAEFSKSWSLFHSAMKEKFSKGNYIQDRAHVFMNHFGVETFTYTLEKPEELKKWKLSKDSPTMKNVYKILVTQTYKGKYGNFDLKQEVYVIQEKGKWKIAWDYNQ
jgi:hypothetical protein